jgi:3-oxoacyl-[acyl-carrier-protein] synthase-3
MRAIITGIGHYIPKTKLTNRDLEQMVDTTDEWITTRTGIKERRILEDGKGSSYMAAEAARMVLQQRRISADEIDLIIVATVTPDMPVPATAALVQDAIQARNCWGFDLNGGCTGFVCALATASQFIETGRHRKVLVIGSDKMSSILDYHDRNTCVLFGDAAGAVLLEPSQDDDVGIEDFQLHLDGAGHKYLYMQAGGSRFPATHETVARKMHYVQQDGRTVFKHAVTRMSDISLEILSKNRLKGQNLKLLIPHQANFRIIDAVAKKMELQSDQVVVNIDKYGNTTAATIPLAMSEAYCMGKMERGDWIAISAFGAGFTWGSLLLRWALEKVETPVEMEAASRVDLPN